MADRSAGHGEAGGTEKTNEGHEYVDDISITLEYASVHGGQEHSRVEGFTLTAGGRGVGPAAFLAVDIRTFWLRKQRSKNCRVAK